MKKIIIVLLAFSATGCIKVKKCWKCTTTTTNQPNRHFDLCDKTRKEKEAYENMFTYTSGKNVNTVTCK